MTPTNRPTVFTSYAQNFEDVVLWRALKHVSNGFYVDIGAQHPVLDSVSKAFYEQGWRGVHVEPVPHYAEMIRQDRPNEQVLQLALSDEPGILELYVIENSGLSTAVKAYADGYEKDHGFTHKTIETPMLPMKTALAFLAGRPVHWLKIDVEGLEEQVLRGWDSKTLRPWVMVIEATVPMSPELRYEGAERLILEGGYRFAYFDGLNRYYVANEHAELIPALSIPPNVFDEFELSGLSGTWCKGAMARARNEMQPMIDQLTTLRQQAETRAEQADAQNHESARLSHEASLVASKAEARAAHATVQANQAAVRASQADARNAQAEQQAAAAKQQAAAAKQQAAAAKQRAAAAEQRTAAAEQRTAAAEQRAAAAEERARLAERTFSSRVLSAVQDGRILSGGKRRIRSLLRHAATTVNRHTTLKRGVRMVLSCIPPLKRRLGIILAAAPANGSAILNTPEGLSPDAATVHRQIKQSQRGSKGI